MNNNIDPNEIESYSCGNGIVVNALAFLGGIFLSIVVYHLIYVATVSVCGY